MERFESVRNWKESLGQSALSRGKPLTRMAWQYRLRKITEFTDLTGLNPDQLIAEGGDAAMKRLTDYFLWLTGEGVEGLAPRGRSIGWNSACTCQALIRGFYSHCGIVFPKRFKVPKRRRSAVSQRDSRTPVFDYDEERDLTQMNGLLPHFVSNLGFRDQAIAVCLLATGADAADLLSLKVRFVRNDRGRMMTSPRIPWHGNRLKDGVEFRTYFSREATACLKRYVEQERAGAGDDEPIFVHDPPRYKVVEENGKKVKQIQPLNSHGISENFRAAAERMGYARKGQSNPFRLKRLRHAFREACSAARIDEGYAQALMGHASGVSASYLEKGEGSFLREYIRVEPYLTLFGADRNGVTDLAETVEEQRLKIEELGGKLSDTSDRFTDIYDRNRALEEGLNDEGRRNRELAEAVEGIYGLVQEIAQGVKGSLAEIGERLRRLESGRG